MSAGSEEARPHGDVDIDIDVPDSERVGAWRSPTASLWGGGISGMGGVPATAAPGGLGMAGVG